MDDRRMIAYLLDELDEKERARLEEAYFADDAEFDRLKAVETELIDSYVRGALKGDRRTRFEACYLAGPDLRERVELARVLARKADAAAAARPAPGRAWWQDVLAGGWWPRPVLVGVCATAALLLLAVYAWRVPTPAPTPTATQASLDARPASPGSRATAERPLATGASPSTETTTATRAAKPSGAFALVLATGLARSADTGATLTVPAGADTVRIRIDFTGDLQPAYRVIIRTAEGREAWQASDLSVLQPGTRSVAVTVPSGALPKGDYILTLTSGARGASSDPIAEYAFLVKRQ